MKELKDILEKGFKNPDYNLSSDEQAQIWDSLQKSLNQSVAAKSKPVGKIFMRTLLAGAAAAIAAFMIIKGGSPTEGNGAQELAATSSNKVVSVSDSAYSEYVAVVSDTEAETQSEISDASINNTTNSSTNSVTLSDANSVAQNAISEKENSQIHNRTVEEKEIVEDKKVVEARVIGDENSSERIISESSDNKDITVDSKSDVSKKEAVSSKNNDRKKHQKDAKLNPAKRKGKGKERVFALDDASGSRFAISTSSNISSRGKLNVSNNNFIKSVASKVGYTAPSSAPVIEQISETTYAIPLNVSLQVSYNFLENWRVSTGLAYTYLHSKYDGLINKKPYKIKQSLHYVGVPVNLYYSVVRHNSLDVYTGFGGTIEKGVSAQYNMNTYDGSRQSTSSHVKGVQFSANVNAGIEYRFGGREQYGIYLEPRLIYFFDSNIPASIRTDQPLQVEAQVGIRFHLK